jgi:2-hydroxymuconate-semialdehyde hydrolase
MMFSRSMVKSSFIDVAGTRAHYLEAGAGETLLLVHGGLAMECAEVNYGPVIPLLSERFRVIAPDIVGSGLTAIRGEADFSNAAQGRFLLDFIQTLGLEEVWLAGNSNGGWLVQYAAHEKPASVRGLVIVNSLNGTGMIPPMPEGARYLYGAEGRPHRYPTLDGIREYLKGYYLRRGAVTEERVKLAYDVSVRNHENAKARDMAVNSSREDANNNLCYRGKLMHEWADALNVPVLLTWSRENRGASAEDAVGFLRRLKQGEMHVFVDAGHHVQVDQHERWSEVVTDFIEHR